MLKINDLHVSFQTEYGRAEALRGINLELFDGEAVALVGESGCGKSLTARSVMGLLPANASVECGSIRWSGADKGEPAELLGLSPRRRQINGSEIAMIFQDPMTSLDPTMPVGRQIMEGMLPGKRMTRREARVRALELMRRVGIRDAAERFSSYPHQLSGGMRQRIVIAAACACEPRLLICDEPTTALDATTQNRILTLIRSIQRERGMGILYITHDLSVVRQAADYVYVMYAGKIVERGTTEEIFCDARHPYTQGLLASVPGQRPDCERLYSIPGAPPRLTEPIAGDAFAPRNPQALRIDTRLEPPMFAVTKTHAAATWLLHEKAPLTRSERSHCGGSETCR